MAARLTYLWYHLRSSFWFVPGLMVLWTIGLSFAVLAIDHALYDALSKNGGWFGVEAARAILGAIAGSMITVTSLVFSLTLVSLILASQQLGPRLITIFMRDRVNQVVLGWFIATFLFALLVLRSVSGVEDHAFVPNLSVAVALGFVVASLGVLIYFIHHVAISIQADSVVANVAKEVNRLVRQSLRNDEEQENRATRDFSSEIPEDVEAVSKGIMLDASGYVQAVDIASLIECAAARDVAIRLERRPGQFLTARTTIAHAWPSDRVDDALENSVRRAVVVGPRRTPAQDIEYAIGSIVEIALRALSPGVNDPHTALACIDQLGAALETILRVGLPHRHRTDGNGKLCVIAEGTTVQGALDVAFNQIRQNAAGNTAVTIRLVETLTVLLRSAGLEEERQALRKHIEMIRRSAEEFIFEQNDRAAVRQRLDRFQERLDAVEEA